MSKIDFDVHVLGHKLTLLSLDEKSVADWSARHLWRVELRKSFAVVTLRPLGRLVLGALGVVERIVGR